MPLPEKKHYKRFVDFQNDVAVSDIQLAVQEGFRSIEHVKRYTTLGMATDQGKTSNLNGLQLVSELEKENCSRGWPYYFSTTLHISNHRYNNRSRSRKKLQSNSKISHASMARSNMVLFL